ncbi:SLAP domain-containing protein [Companilactobacillus kedongensis]|uniref:SLAP domain-containing protein n=1 Tax=Companilactobacillus kedongensis TaxID=2486004 RepID=UPI0013DE2D68|nr:SLAP domain-containing protein [Companilactobacillus kedongensis]
MKKTGFKFKVITNINNKILLITPAVLVAGVLASSPNIVKADDIQDISNNDVALAQDNIATSQEWGRIGGAREKNTGSEWRIDTENVLHIEAGDWDNTPVDKFGDIVFYDSQLGRDNQLRYQVSSVVFEGPVKAGPSLSGLFASFSGLESISMNKNLGGSFDTSDTTDFSRMFSNADSLKSFDMKMFNWKNVESSSSMFARSGLESVSMDGVKADRLSNIGFMFSDCINLKDAQLNGAEFKEGVLNKTYGMFDNAINLSSLDISSIPLNKTTDKASMLNLSGNNDVKLSKLKSITLPANADLSGTGIDGKDSNSFKSWSSDLSDKPVSKLIEYYNENSDLPVTTWNLAENTYTLNYKDDEGNTVATKKGSGYIGYEIPNSSISLLGYLNLDPVDRVYKVDDQDGEEMDIKVKKLNPYIIKVIVKYGDGHPDEILEIKVPYGLSDAANEISQKDLDKFENNTTLDPSKSIAHMDNFSKYFLVNNDGPMPFAVMPNRYFHVDNYDTHSLKNIFNDLLNYINEKSLQYPSEELSGKVLDGFEVHYGKYVATDTDTGSDGGTVITDKKVTDINQTVATFNDKSVNLYNSDGELIPDIQLASSSDWKNDKKMVLNGVTYYRVSTDTWVKASDIYVYVYNDSKIRVNADKDTRIINPTGKLTDRALESSTEWKTDRYTTINGEKYHRVSTEGFVKDSEVQEYK